MNVYRSFEEIPYYSDTVLTVGTFDGIHRGHQYIISKLLELSNNHKLRNLILTIHPHPQIVLRKENKPNLKLLTSIEERLSLFERYGIENVLVIPFNYEFSQTPASTFINDYLFNKVGFKKILIGYDHLFGKDRDGNESLLFDLSSKLNFDIEKLHRIDLENNRISSTDIRNYIQDSKISYANMLLGHHYGLRGLVIHGHKRGRTIGFPTANLLPDDENKLVPSNGVYVVYFYHKNTKIFGMANIGFRPTVSDEKILSIEAHFFDFNEDIYDQNITIYFIEKIRDEKKFDSIQQLIEQLNHDRNLCKTLIINEISN
ncbi:bifunctional riboflavin kinase/FAD synthetase [Candidatus Kapaibacterium sp.]